MPDEPLYRKTPSVLDLRRKRAADEAASEADHATREAALRVVERWNTERSVLWSATIRCAVVAGTPWLDAFIVHDGGPVGRSTPTLDRHPLGSVGSRCSGSGVRGARDLRRLNGVAGMRTTFSVSLTAKITAPYLTGASERAV
jgi:hypothetical protein